MTVFGASGVGATGSYSLYIGPDVACRSSVFSIVFGTTTGSFGYVQGGIFFVFSATIGY